MRYDKYYSLLKESGLSGCGVVNEPFQEVKSTEIVLAEDDIDEQYFFVEAINELPITARVKVVPDGVKLLDYLLSPLVNQPDIIFLDIMMPRKDGIECLKEIKQDERLKMIPIVMYSNSVGGDYIMKTYEFGASFFLQKGNYPELTASIEVLLNIVNKDLKQRSFENFKFSLREYLGL